MKKPIIRITKREGVYWYQLRYPIQTNYVSMEYMQYYVELKTSIWALQNSFH